MRYLLTILLTSLLVVKQAGAQLYVRAENFTVRDGLSDNRIKSLLKDHTGYIWVGTNNGLNRYNGHSFRIFRPGSQNSISNEVINDIVADDSGYIWVATMDGLNRYDPKKDRWTAYQPETNPNIKSNLIWDLFIDSLQQLWIVSDVRSLTSYNLRTGEFRQYDWPAFAASHPVINKTIYRSIHKIVPAGHNRFYLGTNRGLVKLDTKTKEFSYLGGNYHETVRDIRYDEAKGRVTLVTEESEVFLFEEKTGAIRKIIPNVIPYPSRYWEEPSKDDYWLASPDGLINWQREGNKLHLQPYLPEMEGSLHPGGVTVVYEEAPGVLWVGTPNGLSRVDRSPEVARFVPLLATSFTDGKNVMASVHYDPVDKAYFVAAGTSKKVFRIDVDGDIISFDRDTRGSLFSTCNAVQSDGRGGLWLLTEEQVYVYNRHQRQFTAIKQPPQDRRYNFRAMTAMPDGSLWFASFSGGLWRYYPDRNFWDAPEAADKNHIIAPTSLYFDSSRKRLWIGTFGSGLFSYTDTGRFQSHFPPANLGYTTTATVLIHDLTGDRSGRILMATEAGGIFVLGVNSDGTEKWTQYSMRNGLQSNNILSVVAGNNGEIWALSGRRVHHLDSMGNNMMITQTRRLMQISNHASDQRLPHGISFDASRNQMLFASGGGLMVVPGVHQPVPSQLPLVISEINAGEGWKKIFGPDNNGRIDIPYEFNSLDVEYASLHYQAGNAIRYQHRLWGYDKSWVEAGNLFKASYPNLPPGEYKFSIRALGPDGSIIRQSPFYQVNVIPPFWRTWWFVLATVLLCVAALAWWIQSLRHKLRTQKILTHFATSLYGQNTVDEVFWDVARNCVSTLGFLDCVVYQFDEERQMLVQRAAYGPKSPAMHQIINPLQIRLGKGIVGNVALNAKGEIVKDTSKDSRYIVDDNNRYSELAVPVFVDGKLVCVIDSEHPEKGFYTRRDLKLMNKIAEIVAAKISKYKIEEWLRLKIARDLHDEMGSTLTSINIISKMALEQSGGQLSDHLRKIKDHSSRMMDSMSDIVWAINPANDSFGKTVLRMKEFAAEILEPVGIIFYFNDHDCLSNIQLNIEKRKELYMLFKEAITNAAKYSNASEVDILFRLEGNILHMTIVDNGIGFDPEKVQAGNGLGNMRNRAAQMQGEIQIESIPGTGTSIQVKLPLT